MGEGLRIDTGLTLPDSELDWRFSPSGGPGGQHANRSATRAEVRFTIATSTVLSETQKAVLIGRFGPEIRVSADEERSQLRNREAAGQRLAERIRLALVPTRRRVATRPTRGSTERRVRAKVLRSQTKALRRRPDRD